MSIAKALHVTDRTVAIDAIVTAPATLLDATGRRIVVQDSSAAVGDPAADRHACARGRVEGSAPRAGSASPTGHPRLRADKLVVTGNGSLPAPATLHGSPGAAQEWRLVAVTGRVVSAAKLGDRWRAEVEVGTAKVVVIGQPGAGIASTTLAVGRTATVIGIARRPYPSATDRRYAVTPRSPADVRVAGRADADAASATGSSGGTTSPATQRRAGARHRRARRRPRRPRYADRRARAGRRAGGRPRGRWLHARRRHRDRPGRPARPGPRAAGPHRARRRAQRDRSGGSRDGRRHRRRRRSGGHHPGRRPHRRGTRRVTRARHPDRPRPRPARPGRSAARPVGSPAWAARCRSTPGPPAWARWLAISAASVAVTLLRRAYSRRRLSARIAGRLATFAAPAGDPPGGPSAASVAERGSSTIHSA